MWRRVAPEASLLFLFLVQFFFFFYSEYRVWHPLKGNILVITQCTSILNLVALLITSWKQSFVRALPLNYQHLNLFKRSCFQHYRPCEWSPWPSTIMFRVLVICWQSKKSDDVRIICSPVKVNLSVTSHLSLPDERRLGRKDLVRFILH